MTLVAFPLPHRLNLVHWVETSGGWLDPVTTVMSAFTLFGLMSFAVLLLRRHPIAAFGLLFVVLHLAVESSIVNLEMIFEHRMYLPMAGVAIGLAGIAPGFRLDNAGDEIGHHSACATSRVLDHGSQSRLARTRLLCGQTS